MKILLHIILILLICSTGLCQTYKLEALDLIKKGTLIEKNDPLKALEYFEKAIEIDPSPTTICTKVDLLFDLKRYDEALEAINKILNIDPTYLGAYFRRAQIYAILRDKEKENHTWKETLNITEKNLKSNPAECLSLFMRIVALYELDRKQEAEKEIERLEQDWQEIQKMNKLNNDCDIKETAHRARLGLRLIKDNKRLDMADLPPKK